MKRNVSFLKESTQTQLASIQPARSEARHRHRYWKTFPSVCKVSIKLNTPLPLSIKLTTPLPASAACDRLFSLAGLLFSPRRARMDSSYFENQLLLKLNRSFYSLK